MPSCPRAVLWRIVRWKGEQGWILKEGYENLFIYYVSLSAFSKFISMLQDTLEPKTEQITSSTPESASQ